MAGADIARATALARSLEIPVVTSEEVNSAEVTNHFMWQYITHAYPQLVCNGLFSRVDFGDVYATATNLNFLEAVAYVAYLRSQVYQKADDVCHPDDKEFMDYMAHANLVFWLKIRNKWDALNEGRPVKHTWMH